MRGTRQRTYSRESWETSQTAWSKGRFSHEWREWRHLAAMSAGIIFPPDGDAADSWGDGSPSQRAILIRAIRETPTMLRQAIGAPGVRSWGDVIERLLVGRDGMRELVDQAARDAESERQQDPTPRQATYGLRSILDLIGQS